MAARNGSSQQYTLMRDLWTLIGKCVGNGAANPTALKGLGITSIVWVSTGKYTITLDDKWAALVGFKATVINSAGTTLSQCFLEAETVATTKTLTLHVFGGLTAAAPARRDLTSADTLRFEVTLSNSVQVPTGY